MDFWGLIDDARAGSGPSDPGADPERLRAALSGLDDGDVLAFGRAFAVELARLNRWDIWNAGYVAASGMGDDGFHYFRAWLIGKGHDAVEQALRDPDGLVPYLDDSDLDNELLEYVAVDLLEERGSGSDPRRLSEWMPDADPAGARLAESQLERRYPRMAAWARSRPTA